MTLKLKNRRVRKRNQKHASLKHGDLIYQDAELQDALRQIKPDRIILGYLGETWEDYVPGLASTVEVILSPTAGTNPEGVKSLVKKLTWDRVHFYTRCHAKAYIGNDLAISGSANLSYNGFDRGKVELMTVHQQAASLRKLREIFEFWKAEAKAEFPSTKQKKDRLLKLEEEFKKSQRKPDDEPRDNLERLSNLKASDMERIHFTGFEYDEDSEEEVEDSETTSKDEEFSEKFIFQTSGVKKGDWIVHYFVNNDDTLRGNGTIYGFRVDQFETRISKSDPFIAKQLSEPSHEPPFELDDTVIEMIRDLLGREAYAVLREPDFPLDDERIKTAKVSLLRKLSKNAKKRI